MGRMVVCGGSSLLDDDEIIVYGTVHGKDWEVEFESQRQANKIVAKTPARQNFFFF